MNRYRLNRAELLAAGLSRVSVEALENSINAADSLFNNSLPIRAYSFTFAGSDGRLKSTSTVDNGELLIGVTGGDPVKSTITGTSNQVIVTNGPGSITLSLPQNIHSGASPSFAGLTLSGLTANAFVYSGVGKAMTSAPATDGQLLIGKTGFAPTVGEITGTPNQIDVTLGAGSIALSGPQDLASTSTPTFEGVKIGSCMGSATLVAGTKTVATSLATATAKIFLSRATSGGTLGHLSYTVVAGVSFTINSTSATDTSVINWLIVDTP